MKKNLHLLLLLVFGLATSLNSVGQCLNAGFENGTLIGWSGTFSQSTDIPQTGGTAGCAPGTCNTPDFMTCFLPCVPVIAGIYPDPFRNKGFSIGTPNQASDVPPENSHFIMSSGFDAIVGNALPVVNPNNGGAFSARLGNAQKDGGGESMMYKYTVDSSNSSFTYSYAVVLDGGSHEEFPQPFFKIRMYVYDANGDSSAISCATYDVNGLTAPKIGGFQTTNGAQWKNWSSVTVPLDNYIGKQVAIQFITRDCCPNCTATDSTVNAGSH